MQHVKFFHIRFIPRPFLVWIINLLLFIQLSFSGQTVQKNLDIP